MRIRKKYLRETTLAGLSLAVLALVGCAAPYTYYCDDACGPQALSGRYGGCGPAPCEPCAAPCAAPCDATCATPCAAPCCGHTITGLLRSIFTCGSGCGEIYCGEWCYDPPDACDPCNDHGDWVGPRCCPAPCWTRFWQGLHGARFCETACCEPTCGGSCDGCNTTGPSPMEGDWRESVEPMGEFEMNEPALVPQPLGSVTRANQRETEPYYSRHPNSRLVRRPTQ